MLNTELFMVFVPAVSWLLFALGGTQISNTIPGWKGWRRFILPAVYLLACLIAGIVWWRAVLVAAIAGAGYSLGYGEGKAWWQRFMVGAAYALITISIGLSIWNVFTAIAFIILFWLSNTKITANIFVWKVCEGFFGLFCGIQLAYVLMGQGLIW
jgi:hypothetical protein